MPEIFNLPTKEQFDKMNDHLSKIAYARDVVDHSVAPGKKELEIGDTNAGFFGFVKAVDLITGDNLALALGLSSGTSQNSDTPWIKYIWNGKVCFTPLKTIRHSVTWDAIYNAGAVYGSGGKGTLPPEGRLGTELTIDALDNSINTTGHFLGDKTSATGYYDTVGAIGDIITLEGWSDGANNGDFTIDSVTDTKIIVTGGVLVTEVGSRTKKLYPKANVVTQNAKVTIGGLEYTVRLFKGAANDPQNSYADADRGSIGDDNEWNGIMLPLHERAKTQEWNYPAYAGTTPYWGVNLTDEDLRTHYTFGSGSYTWCQEVRDDNETFRRVFRGYTGASNLLANYSWSVGSGYGFRPVLELPQTATL